MKKTILLSLLLLAALAFVSCTSASPTTTLPTTPSGATTAPPVQPSSVLAAYEQAIADIYTAVNPSVVYIEVIPEQIINAVSGSGFVWDNNGHIVTNDHVISGGGDITVTFYDGTVVPASVIGEDADADLAVLKYDTADFKARPVTMGDSASLKVGQLVVAIGNPFGLQSTLTVGQVSGLSRTIPGNVSTTAQGTYNIPAIIQTDASINPGNSGGVLVDSGGRVIGVPSAIESPSGTSAGVGFAIPQAIVQRVVPALIASGHYSHPYLGISGGTMSPNAARAMSLPDNQRGALVATITAGGPAAQAGLQGGNKTATILGQSVSVGGDIITAIDGQAVNTFDDLVAYLELSTTPGQKVTLSILRGNQAMQVSVTLGARPGS